MLLGIALGIILYTTLCISPKCRHQCWGRAYFKESLQLHRNDKFLTSKKLSSFSLNFFSFDDLF